MAQKNFGNFAKVLKPQVVATLEKVAEDVKKEIDEALQRYYDEYDPAFGKLLTSWFYQRTDQLKNCCKIGNIKISGDTVSIEVYLDIDSLSYSAKNADPYKTVVAANAGLHGGWDVSNLSLGQIPWSSISGNDGTAHGSGTQIWEESIGELFDGGKLITLFKKHAKAHGLNLK